MLAATLALAYTATLGLDAFDAADYGGDEPHYLLAAQSLVVDGDLDVLDDYRERAYAGFYPQRLDMHGEPAGGALHEPHGAGFPVLIAPAFAVGGAVGVELLLAALAAGCGVLAYLLARRVAPERWAFWSALAVGLSPTFLAYGSAVYPELAAGAALAGAALLALRLRERAAWPEALGCAALLAALPWLGTKYVPAGLVIGVVAIRAFRRHERRLLAAGAIQIVGVSALAYVLVNEALYGGPTPYAADVEGQSATDAAFPLGYLERSYRLVALLVDRDYGVLRWTPVLALALVGAWLALRGRGGGVRAQPAIALCSAVLGTQLLVAAFLAPTMFGFWFPGRHLLAGLPFAVPLVALGLRRLPRTGLVLVGIGLVASLWLYAAARLGSANLAVGWPDVPWGPLDAVLPYYGSSPLVYALTAAAALALAALTLARSRRRASAPSR